MANPEKKQRYYAHVICPDGEERRVSDFLAILKDPERGFPKGFEPEKVLPILEGLDKTGVDSEGIVLTEADFQVLMKLIPLYKVYLAERSARITAVPASVQSAVGAVYRK